MLYTVPRASGDMFIFGENDGRVYTSSGDGFAALNASSGVELWRLAAAPGSFYGQAPLYDALVFQTGFQSPMVTTTVVDRGSGSALWFFHPASSAEVSVDARSPYLYAFTSLNTGFVMDGRTGRNLSALNLLPNTYTFNDGTRLLSWTSPSSPSTPAVYSYDVATGKTAWGYVAAGPGNLQMLVDPNTGHVLVQNATFGAPHWSVSLLDWETGVPLWSQRPQFGYALLVQEALFSHTMFALITSNDDVFVYNLLSGEPLWSRQLPPVGNYVNGYALDDSTLYVTFASAVNMSCSLLGFSHSGRGQPAWNFTNPDEKGRCSPPAVLADGVIVFASFNSNKSDVVWGLRSNGSVVWKVPVGHQFTEEPPRLSASSHSSLLAVQYDTAVFVLGDSSH